MPEELKVGYCNNISISTWMGAMVRKLVGYIHNSGKSELMVMLEGLLKNHLNNLDMLIRQVKQEECRGDYSHTLNELRLTVMPEELETSIHNN